MFQYDISDNMSEQRALMLKGNDNLSEKEVLLPTLFLFSMVFFFAV